MKIEDDLQQWARELSEDSFVAVFDVALDIHQALELSTEKYVEIPLLQLVVKFEALLPKDGVQMRDRYCDLRSNATGILKKMGVIRDFVEISAIHRWQNVIRVEADKASVDTFVSMMRRVYKDRTTAKEIVAEGPPQTPGLPSTNSVDACKQLLLRFHTAALQLRKRHGSRPPYIMEDEYDVQDLLGAVLFLKFDDVRREEWTPSYAGGSSRIDFVLKQEKILIEVKKPREGLGAKEIGEQLIVDIEKYRVHPDCKDLVCFVYDPSHRIGNPRGLEADLNGPRETMNVHVIIAPRT